MTVSTESVRDLAVHQPGTPVLSVYVRTDPRDPANTAAPPGWLVELRNGLREVSREAEEDPPRERGPALPDLCRRVEQDVLALQPSQRARGLAWFLTADGTLNQRFTLQLPPRRTLVRWDARPFVSPLVDVVDRGRPTGLVLVGTEAVRLLHWQAGRVEQPQRSLYELEPGKWRDYDAYVGHPGRSAAGRHVATFDQRVEEWRRRFLRDAALATGQQLSDLGWQRVLLAGERRVADAFAGQLPAPVREQVVAVVDVNLLWEKPAAVTERLEEALDEAWRRETSALVDRAIRVAHAGGAGAIGWAEVLDTLVHHRVEHLVFAAGAAADPDLLAPHTRQALGGPSGRMLVERAVEHAVASGAQVSAAPEEVASLARAGGAVATLRY